MCNIKRDSVEFVRETLKIRLFTKLYLQCELFCKILFSKSYEDILYKRCMKTIECSLSIFIVPISNINLTFVCKIFCSRHCSFCNELLSISNTISSYFVNCKKTCLHVFVWLYHYQLFKCLFESHKIIVNPMIHNYSSINFH